MNERWRFCVTKYVAANDMKSATTMVRETGLGFVNVIKNAWKRQEAEKKKPLYINVFSI